MDNQHVREFINRMPKCARNIVTLAGTGPNGTSQFPILRQLGRERLAALAEVNLISASSVSYFMYIAATEGGFNAEGYSNYESQVREIHQGGLVRFFKHIFLRKHKKRAFFCNELLTQTLSIFFEEKFLALPLGDFDKNLRCHSFCKVKNRFVVLSPETHPDMTIEEVCRACCSVPFLHGQFSYRGACFIDPMFSSHFNYLRKKMTRVDANHLYANIKYDGEYQNILFVKNRSQRFPVLFTLMEFFYLCVGIPNRAIESTHKYNLRHL